MGRGEGMHERKAREGKWSVTELGRAHEGVLASGLWEVGTGKPIPPLRALELELGQAVPEAGSPYHPEDGVSVSVWPIFQ